MGWTLKEERCPSCGGSGQKYNPTGRDGYGPCHRCGGTGTISKKVKTKD